MHQRVNFNDDLQNLVIGHEQESGQDSYRVMSDQFRNSDGISTGQYD